MLEVPGARAQREEARKTRRRATKTGLVTCWGAYFAAMRLGWLGLAAIALLRGAAGFDAPLRAPGAAARGVRVLPLRMLLGQSMPGSARAGPKTELRALLNSLLQQATSQHERAVRVMAPHSDQTVFTHLAADLSKFMQAFLLKSDNPTVLAAMGAWKLLPQFWKKLLTGMALGDVFLFIFFQLTYRRAARMAHQLQILSWKWLALGTPLEFKKSMLGFAEERGSLLAKIMGCNYLLKMFVRILQKLGFRIDAGLPILMSKIAYTMYAINFIDLFKSQFLHTFFPSLAENRRQSYVVNRSTSVIIWVVGVLAACEMVSTYFKVPLSSTLAFGGVGGIALGLSARDIAANFLGGMLLLFNEPFTPGDMVTFRSGNTECVGRVERVGWGQTRIRGRDTRPTYVPNSHFVQTAVTNMERITHRKFEATIPIRFQDHVVMPEILAKVKEALRALPKLDVLSMPFRVSFVKFGAYALEIEITCYFATKSIDEFLALQQMANLEIVRVIRECGAQLALPTTLIHMPPAGGADPTQGVFPLVSQLPSASLAQPAVTTTKVTQVTTASVVIPAASTTPPPAPALAKPSLETQGVTVPGATSSSLSSKKKDLPPLATKAAAAAAGSSATAPTTTAAPAVATAAAAAVVAAASTMAAAAAGGAGVGSQGQMPAASSSSSQKSASSKSVAVEASSSSTLTSLSPAAAAILKEAQAGSYISETLGGKIKGSSTSSTSAAAQQKPKLVVGPPVKAGPPTQLPSPQPDPRTKKAPADLPQAPLPPTASTPPNTATVQAQITAQQLQQKQLLKPAMRRNPTAPVFSEDGSLSWSWIEIEASILENGDEDSDGRPTSAIGTGF